MFWEGYRQFIIKEVRDESGSAKSFFLVPADGGKLAQYFPGQHLPIRITVEGAHVSRCYTLSDCFNGEYYRLTIKRERAIVGDAVIQGLVSGHFYDRVQPGCILEAKVRSGNFYLHPTRRHPAVLLAGGMGVTPMISMINSVAEAESARDIHFFFALRDRRDHAFRRHLLDIAAPHPNIRMAVFYESLLGGGAEGIDYHERGRIALDHLRNRLPSFDMEFFLCGPGPMMTNVSKALVEAGVAAGKIRTESFGPSSLPFSVARSLLPQPASSPSTLHAPAKRSHGPDLSGRSFTRRTEWSGDHFHGQRDSYTAKTRLLRALIEMSAIANEKPLSESVG